MNELVKGQWWFSLKTNYWCWEGTAVWLGSNSPATPAEDSKPVHPPHTLPTTQQPPTLLHPITPWECCQPGRWGETGSGKDKTPSHWDLNWNKAEVKRGYWESDYSRKSKRGWERKNEGGTCTKISLSISFVINPFFSNMPKELNPLWWEKLLRLCTLLIKSLE